MVRFTQEQRQMLIDKLSDAANLALGALVFGQFLGDRPFSGEGSHTRHRHVVVLLVCSLDWRRTGTMTGLYIIFGGMMLFAIAMAGYDYLTRRRPRRGREERRSA